MKTAFVLAFRYMAFHRLRTMLLVAAVTLTLMLPLATRWTIERFREQSLQRAQATPMVIGAKGSSFGLTLHSLYFRGDTPPVLAYGQRKRIDDYGLGKTLPILARYRAQGHLVVGVTDEYLTFRALTLAEGEPLERWGDCLVGWRVARELGIKTGDRILSEPENMLDLSAVGPLKLRVRGILSRSDAADDDVIFCHLETAWIIAGIGHGHHQPEIQDREKELSTSSDTPSVSAAGSAPVQPASAEQGEHPHTSENLERLSEITDESLGSFHFHGNRNTYPLTAIIVLPDSQRSATLLEGKYLAPEELCQVVIPSQVVSDLLLVVARVQQLLDAVSMLLGIATLILLVLVMWLSLRLRAAEMRTLRLLGAGSWSIAQIMVVELAMIVVVSLLTAFTLSIALVYNLDAMQLVVFNRS